MFQGFTQKTSDFFWELAFNNERSWFLEHKQEFEDWVNSPFRALAQDTFALMQQRYPQTELKLHISRIYRDARRLHGRGPYKDHLWFSIKKSDGLLDGPFFWFELGAADYRYGMGFFNAGSSQMAAFRSIVDANPARFERLIRKMEAHGEFHLIGEEYKRPKGNYGEPISRWYSRKQLGMECSRDFGGDILTERLPQILTDGFAKLMPLYEFFLSFYREEEAESKAEGGR